jgi:hypothetical protein
MDSFFIAVYSNPLHYIGLLLSLVAVVGILLFLRGFGSGIGNIFHMHGHDEHLHHARVRIVWGVYLCMVVLGIWEAIRLVLGEAPLSSWLLVVVLLAPAWIPGLKSLLSGGGH